MKLKPGVSLAGIQPEMWAVVIAAEPIWYSMGADLVITSCTDGNHKKGSRHYIGYALDLRTRDMNPFQKMEALEKLMEALGDQFDIIAEPTHIHAEYDPERINH